MVDVVVAKVVEIKANAVVEVEEIGGRFQSTEVDGNKPCPIHLGTNHKWNNCRLNQEVDEADLLIRVIKDSAVAISSTTTSQ